MTQSGGGVGGGVKSFSEYRFFKSGGRDLPLWGLDYYIPELVDKLKCNLKIKLFFQSKCLVHWCRHRYL